MLNYVTPAVAETKRAEETQGIDLREAIGFLWRQWMFIASVLGMVLVITAAYVLTRTPRYSASALVLLESQTEKVGKEDAILSEVNLDYPVVESQLAIIRSTVFLQRVVEKLRLYSDPEFGSGSHQGPEATPAEILAATQALGKAVTASRAGQGYVISISVTSVDPERAATIANAVADAYVVEKLDARFDAAQRASAWLSDRLVELRQQLHDSEEAVAKFRADHGLVQSGSNITLSQQQLQDLNAKLVSAKTDLAEKKALADLLKSIKQKGGSIQSVPGLPVSPTLQALRAQEAAISQKEADLEARYNDRHPLVVNAQAEHGDVQRAINAELQRLAANIDNDYELAKARERAVESEFRQATGQSDLDDQTAIALRELERTAAVNKNLFEDFLQRAKITEAQSTFEAHDARVITPALRPSGPSYPRKGQFMALALIFGLFLGVGGAIAKDKLNGGFATPKQIEDMLQLPLLSSVNMMDQKDLVVKGTVVRLPIYPAVSPLSRYSESIRILRNGVQMANVDDTPKVVQLTSTVPNEGKTTIGLSLAVSAAVSGLKVLFIDADLRHTSATNFFGMLKQPGLVDVLLDRVNPDEAIRYVEGAKLWVLSAGTKTRNPADLLASNRMKTLIDQCRELFDYVVIDSPPLGPVIDPVVLSQIADTVVYVVRWASTARELVQQSIQRLDENKIAGIVFNLVNERAAQKYGKYAYQYYYGASRSYKKYYES